jgi:hypothetical protein
MVSLKSFQDKVVFPAPECSYTSNSSSDTVLYIPRTILADVDIKLDRLKNGDLNYTEIEQTKPVVEFDATNEDYD